MAALDLERDVVSNTVYSKGGMVCSISPLAASAGVSVLNAGGNAFDAVVATAAVECVTFPAGCGLGGEPFALLYEARSGQMFGLSGSGKAPTAATRDFFVDRGYRTMPLSGPLAAALPGEVHGYATILERFGTRSLEDLLEPAIGYAEDGFALSPRVARGLQSSARDLAVYPDTAAIFCRDGAGFRPGDVLVQTDLARTLRRVATGGPEEFYAGDTGREIVRALAAAGGLYTADEFAGHATELYEDPISTTYRGCRVYETSPPSQGLMVLEMLNILEPFDLAGMAPYGAEAVHAMVEAKKLAFADRNGYLGDPDFVSNPLADLLSKEFAAERGRLIDGRRAASHVEPGPVPGLVHSSAEGNTSYLCAIDREGNAASFIHSLSAGFGCKVVAGNTGVLLNNRAGRGFSLVEGHPNVIEPGKRTMHTLNAYMVMKDGRPFMIGGTPGGDNQIPWNVQVISNVIDHGMTSQEAVAAPRWTSLPGTDPATVDEPFVLRLDEGMAPDQIQEMVARGTMWS